MNARSQTREKDGLVPAGAAAARVVRHLRQQRLDDLLALSHTGRRLQINALAAMYAEERDADDAEERLREALAELDRAVEIAKQFGGAL